MSAHMCQETRALAGIGKGTMGTGAPTIGVATTSMLPGDAELLTRVVGRGRMRAQELSHLWA